ncbi:MAG: hypothetical protein ACLGH3_04045 [Actinomycetota bacterium]
MNKDFFSSLDQRREDFAGRVDAPSVAVDVALHSGRVIKVESVTEAAEGFLQIDGVDRNDLETPLSVAVPYHQIASVVFVKERPRMGRAGF